MKHRGDQKIRKASSNTAQQEPSLDLSIQSSASSSSKGTGHEERVCSARRSLASSLLADDNVDDSECGQQLLAEPLSDRLVNNLPTFDQSSLAEPGQPITHQDGDDILNLSFSPLPVFSTILPSTYPEPFQPAATRTSEDLLSASSSSGDEIPPYLPPTALDYMNPIYDSPTRQSKDLSLFGSNATPTSLPESTSVSTAFSSQSPSGQSCQCLAAVVFAVEELEANCNSGNRADLDSIVAYQKEAIKSCHSMLRCSSCVAKRENLVLLVFVTEKIVVACGRIIGSYRMRDGDAQAGSIPSSLPTCSPLDRVSHRANVEDGDLATSASSSSSKTDCTHSGSILPTRADMSSDWRGLLVGDYEISSPLEWEHVVRVLICLQLRAVMGLLADMKSTGSKVLREMQTATLAQAEITVGKLEKAIYIS